MDEAPELCAALKQIQVLADSRDRAEEELQLAHQSVVRLQDELAQERTANAKLEAYVRRVALAPEPAARTGGGYLVDSTAKQDAVNLLKDSAIAARQAAGADLTGLSKPAPKD